MKIQILLFDGFDELDVVAPYEIFQMAAAKGAELRTALVSLEGAREVVATHGLRIFSEAKLEIDTLDLLLVPGGGWADAAPTGVRAEIKRGAIPEALVRAHGAGKILASVCTGALLLAHAGLLKGRRGTTHHLAQADLRAAGVDVMAERVVDDGDLITSGGVTSGIDLSLYLVKRFADKALAEEIAAVLEYPL